MMLKNYLLYFKYNNKPQDKFIMENKLEVN